MVSRGWGGVGWVCVAPSRASAGAPGEPPLTGSRIVEYGKICLRIYIYI